MQTESQLLQALRRCPKPDFGCRLANVNQFGLSALKDSFSRGFSSYTPPEPTVSWETIEKGMDAILKGIGKAIGKPFSYTLKAYRLIYKPHFELLKMFDKSFEKYWNGIDFARWCMTSLSELETELNKYIFYTGNFEMRAYFNYFTRIPESNQAEYNRQVQNLRSAASLMAEFDKLLVKDIDEMFKAMNFGMDQLWETKLAENKLDQILLMQMEKELQLLLVSSFSNLSKQLNALVEHARSWESVNGGFFPARNFNSQIQALRMKIEAAILEIIKKQQGKK